MTRQELSYAIEHEMKELEKLGVNVSKQAYEASQQDHTADYTGGSRCISDIVDFLLMVY